MSTDSRLLALNDFTIELPSWAFGNSGTRFKVFTTPGVPRDPWLRTAQDAGDVLGAHAVLMDAFNTDVRAVLADAREDKGLPRDPVAAFRESGYLDRVSQERVGGVQTSWGGSCRYVDDQT